MGFNGNLMGFNGNLAGFNDEISWWDLIGFDDEISWWDLMGSEWNLDEDPMKSSRGYSDYGTILRI